MISSIIFMMMIIVSPYVDNGNDVNILYRITEAEATGGTFEQKVNVAQCVIARVKSKGFPNTIEEVVFEKGQFTPIKDKRYYSVSITESTKSAVNYALLHPDLCHGCTYFCTDCESYRTGFHSRLKEEFFDGVHHYFTE